MAAGAADGFFRCAYDSSLSGWDNTVEHRPYHRNCGCPLHKPRRGNRPAALCPHSLSTISFPMKKSWSESCLVLMAASPGSSPVPSSPAAVVSGQPRNMAASTVFSNDDGGK